MRQALRPVVRRIRCQRGLTGAAWGLLAAAAACAVIGGISFLLPLARRGQLMVGSAMLILLGGLIGLLWPVSLQRAAARADACGLQERAQTALGLQARTDEMARLQREDAARSLTALDVQKALPLRWPRGVMLTAGGCAALCLLLMLLPNPQERVLRVQEQFRQAMEKPSQALEQLADHLEPTGLDEKTARELRRLLGDLAREVGASRTAREALTALSRAQQQVDRLLDEDRSAAIDALGQAGLDGIAQALSTAAGDAQAIEEALQQASEASSQEETAQQLADAAASASSAGAAQALQAAAQALSQGSGSEAAQALSQLNASAAAAGQLAAALQGVKSAVSGQTGAAGTGSGHGQNGGQGSGQGQGNGQGQGGGQGQGSGQGEGQSGGGAGQGSTNTEQSGGSGGGGTTGQADSHYQLGIYESIYDPTRLGNGGEISQSTGTVAEDAQLSELTLGPGLGDASGDVPYDQVIGEYAQAAAERAQEAALPAYAQQWINDYFSALTQ